MKKSKVFIFGAGATRGGLNKREIPPPIDMDFFDIANQITGRGTPILVKKVLRQVWELYQKTSGVSMEYYFRDIESRDIITKVSRSLGQPVKWSNRLQDLKELIRRVYVQTTCDIKDGHLQPSDSELHQRIMKKLKKNDTIITFNYDLVIEESFDKRDHKQWNPRYGYGTRIINGLKASWARKWIKVLSLEKRRDYSFPECDLTLLKLHGSLNWRINKYTKRIILKPYPFHVETRKGAPREETVSVIPPGILKDINESPIARLWHSARKALEDCDSLVILGYSLPETDFLAHSLFNEVVRSRLSRKKPKYLHALHIADPKQDVVEKFVKIFTPIIGPTGKMYKYDSFEKFCNKEYPK